MMASDEAKDAKTDLLNAIALAVHRIVGNMPVAIKFRGWPGTLVENGAIVDGVHESRELDRALLRPDVIEVRLSCGRHAGRVMYASPIVLENATHAVGVIGVIDTSGVLKLKELAENHTALNNQVAGW